MVALRSMGGSPGGPSVRFFVFCVPRCHSLRTVRPAGRCAEMNAVSEICLWQYMTRSCGKWHCTYTLRNISYSAGHPPSGLSMLHPGMGHGCREQLTESRLCFCLGASDKHRKVVLDAVHALDAAGPFVKATVGAAMVHVHYLQQARRQRCCAKRCEMFLCCGWMQYQEVTNASQQGSATCSCSRAVSNTDSLQMPQKNCRSLEKRSG